MKYIEKILFIIIAILTMLLYTLLPQIALADDDNDWTVNDFYSANDVNFYADIVCNGSSDDQTSGDASDAASSDNATAIFKFFISNNFKALSNKPMNAIQAAAFMGNMYGESGLNPGSQEVGGGGYGLVQWTGGRRTKLEAYASQKGKPASDLGVQLDFLKTELDGAESGVLADSEFQTTKDVGRATEIVLTKFERAGVLRLEVRQQAAQKYYDQYKSLAPSVDDGSGSGCTSTTAKLSGSIAEIATQMGGWGGQYKSCYVWGGGHGKDKAWYDKAIENHFVGEYGVDCSGFVTAVIYKATGNLVDEATQGICNDKKNYGEVSDPQPGDISITCSEHVEVITKVNSDGTFDTIGSHKTGCGVGYGASPGHFKGEKVLRYIGAGK